VVGALYIDADACPVKDEAFRVAQRYMLHSHVVSNSFIRLPASPLIHSVVVDAGPDAADDWIAQRCGPGDIVVTQDIPLAKRALDAGAQAIGITGKPYTADSIGSALAGREIGGPLPLPSGSGRSGAEGAAGEGALNRLVFSPRRSRSPSRGSAGRA
jgi:uncharacterized protein YaiI (UPF0178 family)